MIVYQITAADPKAHLINVQLLIEQPQQPFQRLRLPNWIPGSYLIRDFSKHLQNIQITDNQGQAIELQTLDKSNWQFSSEHPVTVEYQVYAWDLSVRGAHFDESHAFFNGTSVFLEAIGQAEQTCQVELCKADFSQSSDWKVATGMPALEVDDKGFGLYQADSYQELIDYPFELGTFTEIDFEACGVPHKMVLTGLFDCDLQRLKQDLIKICETEIKLFGQPAPMDNYLFQVMVTGSDYGGLEHRNSTALICSRNDLPYIGMTDATDGYLQFLELCSHEYFHSWNVKRIQPLVYQQSDLQGPVYTNQLWWFEGITSYYDSLILYRAGLIDKDKYLNILSKELTRVTRMPGRFKQSVADSSWNTWTKFYQQDENAPNAIISYYAKGSMIALALDLTIRQQTNNAKSLDDVLLYLWQYFGKTQTGLIDGQIEAICSEVSGLDLSDFFAKNLFATEDFDFSVLMTEFGVEYKLRQPTSLTDMGGKATETNSDFSQNTLGANIQETAWQSLKITHIWNQQACYQAGLASGDEIIAVNNIKITSKPQLEQLLKRHQANQPMVCHFFRRDELKQTEIIPLPAPQDRVQLSLIDKPADKQSILSWL